MHWSYAIWFENPSKLIPLKVCCRWTLGAKLAVLVFRAANGSDLVPALKHGILTALMVATGRIRFDYIDVFCNFCTWTLQCLGHEVHEFVKSCFRSGEKFLDRWNCVICNLRILAVFCPVDRAFGWARVLLLMFCGPSSASVLFVEYRCTCASFLVTSRVHPRVEIQLPNGLPFVQLWSGVYATAKNLFPMPTRQRLERPFSNGGRDLKSPKRGWGLVQFLPISSRYLHSFRYIYHKKVNHPCR